MTNSPASPDSSASLNAPASLAARAHAVANALIDSEQLDPAVLDGFVEIAEEFDWHKGAHVVARAWTDPAFKARLLADGTAGCAELGYSGIEGHHIVVVEDEPELKNLIVCTQCSCTAWPVLGLPPDWYKSPAYRSQVVRQPRKVLEEMGAPVSAETRLRVWDTTAETRYLVLPLRPHGTDDWTEAELAAIVTREAMIGVAHLSI